MEDRGEWEADQRGGETAAKDEDGGMFVEEHVQVATHQDHDGNDAGASSQS
jgi:hypothetical protein